MADLPTPKQAHRQRQAAERRAIREAAALAPRQAEQPVLAPELAPPPLPVGGRPVGAQNRATREWVRHLLARHGSPLERLLEIAGQAPEALAAQLGCTRLEAFDRQLTALREAVPFLHQKLPQAIQVEGAPLMAVQIAVSDRVAQAILEGERVEENQRVEDDDGAGVGTP
jgi:hypothetical protein